MQIDIVSDTICPWCYIGKRRLERAMVQWPDIKAEITWRPFQLNPDMAAEGLERRAYVNAKFGGEAQAALIYERVRQAGAEEGIVFAFERIARTPNTLASHRLIWWAASAGAQDRVVELLFRRYFLEGADIGATDVLIGIAAEAGLDAGLITRRFNEGADIDLIRKEDKMARDIGIQGVPCFIVDRRYAVSGAQDPAVFHQVFELAAREALVPAPFPAAMPSAGI
jgi:predicted DsbA family dithiol-disulfide isomerase